jgi:hypothetical protein
VVAALDALALRVARRCVGEQADLEVDVEALGREGKLENAGDLGRANSGGLVVVVERDLAELELNASRVDVRHRADSRVRAARAVRSDVDVGDVPDEEVTGRERERADVEVLEHELRLRVFVLRPARASAYASTSRRSGGTDRGIGMPFV